jgi:hypothetical protein
MRVGGFGIGAGARFAILPLEDAAAPATKSNTVVSAGFILKQCRGLVMLMSA